MNCFILNGDSYYWLSSIKNWINCIMHAKRFLSTNIVTFFSFLKHSRKQRFLWFRILYYQVLLKTESFEQYCNVWKHFVHIAFMFQILLWRVLSFVLYQVLWRSAAAISTAKGTDLAIPSTFIVILSQRF